MRALRCRVAAKRLLGLAALVAATGCNWESKQPARTAGAVAVIDLDAIAQRLGSDKQIAASISQRQTALNQQVVELARNYNAQLAERQKQLATAKGEQETQSDVMLASWQQQANANLNQAKRQAAADLESHRQQLVAQFREHLKPAARRVAQQRGLSVIVTKNDSVVFDFTGASDITEAVIDELAAGQGEPVASPAIRH